MRRFLKFNALLKEDALGTSNTLFQLRFKFNLSLKEQLIQQKKSGSMVNSSSLDF